MRPGVNHMHPTSLRDIYGPEAADAPLVLDAPVTSMWFGRWLRTLRAVILGVLAYWVLWVMFPAIPALLEWLVPDAWRGGHSVAGIMGWSSLVLLVVWLFIGWRQSVDKPDSVYEWSGLDAWMRGRRLEPVQSPGLALLGRFEWLAAGLNHHWRWAVAPTSTAGFVVGSLEWSTDPDDPSYRSESLVFARFVLPERVRSIVTGRCALLRHHFDLYPDELRESLPHELAFESHDLHDHAEIRIGHAPESVQWRQVFDPLMIVAMTDTFDVSWVYEDGELLLIGTDLGESDVVLDTLVAAGQWIGRHLDAIAASVLAARAAAASRAGQDEPGAA